MIVLDEQLLGRGLETDIARWYPGSVRFVTELRPGTVVKDEAIPMLLSHEREPVFLTINESDFWRRVSITDAFGVVCFSLTDREAGEIPALLQRLFRCALFTTKALRMGRVARVSAARAEYYTKSDTTIRPVEDWA